MTAMNLLVIMDDEHNKKVLGCNGHPMVRTPNLDRLAARSVCFDNAYSSSPICVPARAALATGLHVHDTGCWDNAIAYDGRPPSWGHVLRDAGHRVVSIGKLHYGNDAVDGGFTEQIIPMHIEAGVGDLYGLLRNPLPVRHQSADLARSIGPGESSYTRYDRDIAQQAVRWIEAEGRRRQDRPWTLFCSFIAPHSPLIAPPEFYGLYDPAHVPLPKPRARPLHPWVQAWDDCYRFDRHFESEQQRRVAIASYFGLVSFLDHHVGLLMHALESSGLADCTRVLFLSDHGDNLGARALWGKSTMYEESAAVPMMLSGPDLPAGRHVGTPVSHVDIFPTVLRALGVPAPALPVPLRGQALQDFVEPAPAQAQRHVFSEYHAAGSVSAAYMLRQGRHKFIHYTGHAPELFDLQADPEEQDDLAGQPEAAPWLEHFDGLLRMVCDPEATDRRAKRDQAALIQRHGGAQAILARGGSSYTPIPGEEVRLMAS